MPNTFKKKGSKKVTVCRRGTARQAIGRLEKGRDTFILTEGDFSLIDAIIEVMSQTGPAHVSISTWTAAHAHLDEAADLMASARFLSFRMIVDRSFKTRQPVYFNRMIELFGTESIRQINTHAKFVTITNDDWKIVIRTSMNLNNNKRMENIEISERSDFAEFMVKITDDIFSEIPEDESFHGTPVLGSIEETEKYKLCLGGHIPYESVKEASYTHETKQ